MLAIFVVLQGADGVMTFGAVQAFGPVAEANPVLQTWMMLVGPGLTLLIAKGMACALGAVLYRANWHRTLAALTTLVVCAGVGPWLVLLGRFV